MKRFLSLFLYYSILIYLPSNSACRLCVNIRSFILKGIFTNVGINVNVARGVKFGRGSNIIIGDYSGIGEDSCIVCMDRVVIGSDVMIGPEVMILTGGHDYKKPNVLLRKQEIITAPVTIGNDCWIGSRAIILPGVSICDRVIIAAGSIVTKPIIESGIYGGNPARKIKDIPT